MLLCSQTRISAQPAGAAPFSNPHAHSVTAVLRLLQDSDAEHEAVCCNDHIAAYIAEMLTPSTWLSEKLQQPQPSSHNSCCAMFQSATARVYSKALH